LIVFESESAFTKVHSELCKIDLEIQTILCRIDKIEATQIQHERSIDDHGVIILQTLNKYETSMLYLLLLISCVDGLVYGI
jgi:hypothetical protein